MEVRAREDTPTALSEAWRVYGVGLGSSYQHQTLTLSKHFRR
jgi:hypothetical protein